MATTTKPTTHTDIDDPFDPMNWVNRSRRSRGLPLVTDAERDLIQRRKDVYDQCEFSKRASRALCLLLRAHEELQALAEMDEEAVITEAWAKAKLPPVGDEDIDERAHDILAFARDISTDAGGCAWAVSTFIATLESLGFHDTRRGRRQGR